MVVVCVEPTHRFMERSGIATSTRRVATRLWPSGFPADRSADKVVHELYAEENRNRETPSGSQDMIGLVYPGISRLDYATEHEGGVFPSQIDSTVDPTVTAWLEGVLYVLAVEPRPPGYDPLATRTIDPAWVRRLGRCGRECWDAILGRDLERLGAAMTESVTCWSALLPASFTHPALTTDWPALLRHYQGRYPGATASASGGGYLLVASAEVVPGAFQVKIRRSGGPTVS